MPTPAEMVAALREGRTWQKIADLLAKIGADHARSYWHGVAAGRIQPGWRQVDALCLANGQEPPGPPPAERVAAHNIGNVIEQRGAAEYDTLALAYIGDAECAEILVKRRKPGTGGDARKPEVLVTEVTRPRKRRPRLGLTVDRHIAQEINQWRNHHGLTWDEWHEQAHELMRREEER